MSIAPRSWPALAWLVAVIAAPTRAEEPLPDLLRRVPGTANALALLDVKALYSSPIGRAQGWKDRRQVLFEDPILPRDVATIAIAAGIDFDERGKSWNLTLLDLERPVATADLVRAERGTMDVVAGREAVWTPRNAYYAAIAPALAARYSPANRQEFARWLKSESQAPVASLSPFLRRASNNLGRAGQAVVAIDLQDTVPPAAVAAYLKGSKAVPPKLDQARAARVLASIEGLTLTIDAQDAVTGVLKVAFAQSPQPLGDAAKPILLEVLTDLGAEIVDLPAWKATTGASEVVLEGPLSAGSLQRILSLFDLPSESNLSLSSPTARDEPNPAEATRAYFRAVQGLLDDLKAQKSTGNQGASLWYERYARKIDQLPVLDVDPAMLEYGQQVADALRVVSTSFYGVKAATGYRKSMTGGSGYYGGGGNAEAADRIRKQENILADKVHRDTWDQIESRSAALRKSMTQKYRVEF